MHTGNGNNIGLKLIGGVLLCVVSLTARAENPADPGIVKITDQVRQTSTSFTDWTTTDDGVIVQPAPYVVHEGRPYRITGNPVLDLWPNTSMQLEASMTRLRLQAQARRRHYAARKHYAARRQYSKGWQLGYRRSVLDHIVTGITDHVEVTKRGLFGYFIPDGCCGQGCAPYGQYHLVYSADPSHFDQRDGRVYAAEGYGTPVAVPLAPNVSHTYNHGWGIPSSRLTPISTVVP